MPELQQIRLPFEVPYAAQVASEDLAGEFFSRGRPLESDPRWRESGAATAEEYVYWANRACGMACVKMCVEALGGPVQPLMHWVKAGLERHGYQVKNGDSGQPVEVGWLHGCLADLIHPHAGAAEAEPAGLERLVGHLRAGRLVIASVSYEIGTRLPITRAGGHLVVVTGADLAGGRLEFIYAHNPSGRTQALRRHARVSAQRFSQAFAGRIIWAER